ncbi:MAG: hypothetical protein H6Q57_2141 [Geobacteraceae bacterium]|nr:hypothetical protein [Geobacteraceae bacterium]
MTLNVQKRLINFLEPDAVKATITDVRIGLGYTAVRTANGHTGVAWTPKAAAACCTHFQGAGTLAGRPATELLTIGLATANALLAGLPKPTTTKEEVISTLHITPADRVVMVGYFAPVIANLRKAGCRLDIVELSSHHGDTLTPEQGIEALAECTVAIITGTTLINGTLDEVLADVGTPRAAVLLGPSSPLCAEAFSGTKITHVAGSRVREADAVLRVISEGGGTQLMKRHLDFETVLVSHT